MVSVLLRKNSWANTGRLPAHHNCLVFPADVVFNVELEGQTLCLLSPSLTTAVGHHSTNSIQSFFQRREEATTTADDVGKHCSPGGGFNSLHSSSPNCVVFLLNISPCWVFVGSASSQHACSLIHAVTLQGSWIANRNTCQESFRSIMKTSHLNSWSEYDPPSQNGQPRFSQEKNRKLLQARKNRWPKH